MIQVPTDVANTTTMAIQRVKSNFNTGNKNQCFHKRKKGITISPKLNMAAGTEKDEDSSSDVDVMAVVVDVDGSHEVGSKRRKGVMDEGEEGVERG